MYRALSREGWAWRGPFPGVPARTNYLEALSFVVGEITVERLDSACESPEEEVFPEELIDIWQSVHTPDHVMSSGHIGA